MKHGVQRILSFILILSLCIPSFPALAAPSVTLSCDQSGTVPVGTTLRFSVTGTDVQTVAVRVVTPDSNQVVLEGFPCQYTVFQPGIYIITALGKEQAGSKTISCISGNIVIQATGTPLTPSVQLSASIDAQVQIMKNPASIPGLQGPFAATKTHLTANAQVDGGSGTYSYAWSVAKSDGSTHIPESTTENMSAYYDYWQKGSIKISLTVTDQQTGEAVTVTEDVKVQCAHTENGSSALVRQAQPEMVGDASGHVLSDVDICSICSEKITTALNQKKDDHFFTSDAEGELTCSQCGYSVMPASFAEAANIVGSPAYRIYHDSIFPLHSPDGLFRSTATSVVEHRVNDKFLVFLEEAYDVLDNEDFADVAHAIKENIVYETLQDILCERADETMLEAISLTPIISKNESVIKEVGSLVMDEAVDWGLKQTSFDAIDQVFGKVWASDVLMLIGLWFESDKIKKATEEEYAKIAFYLTMNGETDRALRILREEMDSGYTEIIDDLIEKNRNSLTALYESQADEIDELIDELCKDALIDFGAFAVMPGIFQIIAASSHEAYMEAFRAGKSVAEVTSQMRTAAMWNQVTQGINIVASIMAGIKIGHAIGGAADASLYAQDQLMLILTYEISAHANMDDAYDDQSENLYEVTCIYLETLKQGYTAAKALYDSHNTLFARFWESKAETEACITLSNICQKKMDSIDDYLQALNVERSKYTK